MASKILIGGNIMALFLTKLQLQAELNRCLNCKTQPCMTACPVSCNPQEFIRHAKEGEWQQAVHAIVRNNPMGMTCGLICPDKFCMKACTRCHIDFPINIPRVQATILNSYRNETDDKVIGAPNGKKIAIVGAGPAGMAAAARLVHAGFVVDIYESRHQIGGALNMIPPERLPHEVIERDWRFIDSDRIHLFLNAHVDDVRVLANSVDGVIVATGEPHCTALRIPGEEASVSYMDYLYNPEKYKTDGPVAVIGGGNVAADCAFTAARLGSCSVEMFVRRRLADMRISKKEYLELLDAGINLNGMTSPVSIEEHGEFKFLQIRRNVCVGGKWQPLDGSVISLPYFKLIIRAIGSRADEKVTDISNILYAGDCKTGGSTIVEAIASGRAVADEMIKLIG